MTHIGPRTWYPSQVLKPSPTQPAKDKKMNKNSTQTYEIFKAICSNQTEPVVIATDWGGQMDQWLRKLAYRCASKLSLIAYDWLLMWCKILSQPMSEEEARQNKKGLSKNSPVSFCLSWSDMLQELSKPLKDMNELCKAWNFGQKCKISVSGLEITSTFF